MPSLTLGKPERPESEYEHRSAVRCIIIKDSEICIIYVKNGNYYKLPGGGIEAGDPDYFAAAQREALEETGCRVDVMPQLIAQTLEWRGKLKQESYAYKCSVVHDTGKVALTEGESADGLAHQWCSVQEALRKMNAIEPTSELGKFIKKRDTFIVETFQGLQGVLSHSEIAL